MRVVGEQDDHEAEIKSFNDDWAAVVRKPTIELYERERNILFEKYRQYPQFVTIYMTGWIITNICLYMHILIDSCILGTGQRHELKVPIHY